MPAPDQDSITFGPFWISRSERVLRRGDTVVPLPPKAVETLLVLAGEPGRVVEKADLMNRVWPDTFVEEGGLARNISLLRKTLGTDADGNAFIETIPRRGYRFTAPVTRPPSESAARPSLAVLPLRNLSPDPNNEYFADGMTDALIGSFLRIEALQVTSRTSAMRFKGASRPPREIAGELRVDFVLEGSVLLSGDRVRISACLLRGSDEHPLWSGAYERGLADVLALQSDVARDIAREIRVKLTAPERRKLQHSREVHPEAYQHYLRGRVHWNQRTRGGLRQALECFQQAITLDAGFAEAHAGIAETYVLLGSVGYDAMQPHASMPAAREAAQRALNLDPDLAEAHAALGVIHLLYDWDGVSAEERLRQALSLDPSCIAAHQWMGELFLARALPEAAAEAFSKGIALDAFSTPCNLGLGWAYYFSRRYDKAAEQFRLTLGLAPGLPMALYGLGLTCYHQRAFTEGFGVLRQAEESSGGEPASLMLLAATAALMGNRDTARAYLARMQEMSHHTYVPPVYFAFIHAISNDLDDAFNWLERAFDERSSYLVLLRVQPALHNLRADPRYFSLVRRVGL